MQVLYLNRYAPFDFPLLLKLELMNEYVNILVLDTLFILTGITQPKDKINQIFGVLFIVWIALACTVHLIFIGIATARDIKLSCRKKKYAKAYKIWYKNQTPEIQENEDHKNRIKDDLEAR